MRRAQGYEAGAQTDVLAALLNVSRIVSSTLELGPLLHVIFDELEKVLEFEAAGVATLEDDALVFRENRNLPGDFSETPLRIKIEGLGIATTVSPTLGTYIIDDLQDESLAAQRWRKTAPLAGLDPNRRGSHMLVPLVAKEAVIGVLSIYHGEPYHFGEAEGDLAMAFAAHVATAIENARLFERAEKRTRELSALVEISRSVSSTLELETVVDTILDRLKTVVACDAASVTVVEGAQATLLALHRGDVKMKLPSGKQKLEDMPSGERIVRNARPLLIQDTDTDEAMSRWLRRETKDFLADLSEIRSFLGVPLKVRDDVIGWVSLGHEDVNHFGAEDIELTQAFANQVAVAISNARFHEQSQEVAVIDERQRIARDLHDSVSQALYSILLTGSAARTLVDTRPDAVADPLDTIVSLAEGGLAEMRALIFELRPESLEEEGLIAAIEKRATAMRARYGVKVSLSVCEEPGISLEVKEALSRIVQEALHNIFKHAEASHVQISVSDDDGLVTLAVRDDGKGFDTGADFAGHLGLRSMRERAERLGAEIGISSTLGRGTEIIVRIGTNAN